MSLRRSFLASNHYELAHLELFLLALITPLLLQPDDADDADSDADADADAADDADDANENNSDEMISSSNLTASSTSAIAAFCA